MSAVTRTAGVAGSFPVTFTQVPVQPPTLTIYTDPARTVVAVPSAPLVATANPQVWTASYPASLVAGTYYLTFSAVYTVGQPAVLDADDTLTLTAAGVTVGGSVPTLTQLRKHLDVLTDVDDARLLDLLGAAVGFLRTHPRFPLVPAVLDGGGDDPLLRFAILEVARDMWVSAAPRGLTRNPDGEPVYGFGRPSLPPYVASLLEAYRSDTIDVPQGSFPDMPTWSAW